MPVPHHELDAELEEYASLRRPRRGRGFLLLAGGVVLGVVGMMVLGRLAVPGSVGMLQRVTALLTGRRTTVNVSSAAVVERIRALSRLETVEYSMDKIVVGEKENVVLPHFLMGDKLLLIAHGEVTAGIDLGFLRAGDVTVNGDVVRIRMPDAEVFSTRLDNERTKVYSRDTGLLVAADPGLESEVRKAAEEQIGQAAVAEGILGKAKTNAQGSLTALLYGLGFHKVDVE